MNELVAILRQFLQGLRLWVTVTPWEQAIRVRLGKSVTLLGPGVHAKVPLLDMIYLQSVRLRMTDLQRQTITSRDGKTITVSGAIGYEIQSILELYRTLHHAEDTIANFARAEIAEYIGRNDAAQCKPTAIEAHLKTLEFSKYGLGNVRIYLTEFAVVRSIRLIGDYAYGSWGAKLSTDSTHNRTPT